MTDRDLIEALLDATGLTEREFEAFGSMRDWLDSAEHRSLSAKQREWAVSVAKARNLFVDDTENLYSTGRVPRGIPMRKTPGEESAARTLANRPTRPPRRNAE